MQCFGISIPLFLRTVGNQVRQTSRHVAFVNDSLQSSIVSIVIVAVFSSHHSLHFWNCKKRFPVTLVREFEGVVKVPRFVHTANRIKTLQTLLLAFGSMAENVIVLFLSAP